MLTGLKTYASRQLANTTLKTFTASSNFFWCLQNTSDKEQEGKHQYKQHMDVTQSKQIISFNKNYSYIDYDLFKELKASWFIWQKNIYINDWVTE